MLGGVLLTAFLSSPSPETSTIHLQISGVEEVGGQIVLHIFKGPDGFPTKPGFAYREYFIPVKDSNPEIVIKGLEEGEYAIAAFHDTNMNGKLDANFFKIPSEKVGVSNNPKTLFIPSFESAKFTLSKAPIIQKIKLN